MAVREIIEVVRHPARQAADGLHSLGLVHGIARGLGFLAAQRLFGDVPGDLGKAHQPTLAVVDRIDHRAAPEAAAILAHPPAFGFEPSSAQCRFQGALGRAGGAILFGVEDGEVLPQDFVLGVALETLGPGVPAAHQAVGVQEVDGIVHHRVHQQPVALVGGNLRGHVCLAKVELV